MRYVEVSFHSALDSGELLARLSTDDELGSWEQEGVLHLFYPEEKWSPEALQSLKETLRIMGAALEEVEFTVQSVPDQDWNAAWAASLKPIRIGRRIRIRQSWNASDPSFDGIEIIIDPKRAFGSGYHVTTQLVLEWLENRIRGNERLLDIGTGSAILAMIALRLGARSALGIDNDPVALECAREYAWANGFGAELDLRVISFEDIAPGGFDVAVANLDIRTMPGLCRRLSALLSPGGIACLSGIQEQDQEEIGGILGDEGLEISVRTRRDEWIALEVQRRSLSEN
jgi:ribosomal protein L11 methyltransferase